MSRAAAGTGGDDKGAGGSARQVGGAVAKSMLNQCNKVKLFVQLQQILLIVALDCPHEKKHALQAGSGLPAP